ncbi:MAG: hypothetical protein CXT69_00635 [Methanobacteriota archaeon]|nr:MAG: hypothetical protein CXT69_00635 [Euryarchaeota archaeon]
MLFCMLFMLSFLTPLVSAGPVVRVEIDQQPPISIDADSQYQFSASLFDSSNTSVSDTITWMASNGSIDSAGLFTAHSTGNVTIQAFSNGYNDSVIVNVTAGWPSHLSLSANLTEVQLGHGIQLLPSLTDAHGNSAYGHQLSWTISQGIVNSSNVWFPDQVGNGSIEVHWGELSSSVNLSATTGPAFSMSLPTGLSVSSGSSIEIIPIVTDTWGNVLSNQSIGSLQWTSESGSINNGVFTASSTGYWLITCATSNGISAKANITVTSATIDNVELVVENRTFRADEAVELVVKTTDVYGNVEYSTPLLSSWSFASGSLRFGQNTTEWLPGKVGNWTLSLNYAGFNVSIVIDVVHGHAEEILLVTEGNRVSADDEITLYMQASDIRNNRWVIVGTWEMSDSSQDENLESFGTWAKYDANLAGDWQIEGDWFDEAQQQFFSAEITLSVIPGRLANIILQGGGTTISTDEILELNPISTDEDGNVIGNILMNWTVDDVDETTSFRLHRGIYYPEGTGLHEIRAFADGAFTSIMVEVIPGRARNILLDIPANVLISSGSNGAIAFTATGLDLSNNSFLINEMSWVIPEGAAEISAGASNGEWILEGKKSGVWDIELVSEDASHFFELTIRAGDAAVIELVMSSENLKQGDELLIDVRIYDSHGNDVEVSPADLVVSSTAGKITHVRDGSWLISLDEGGTDHAVTIRLGNLTEQRFFDVQEALLSGVFGSSNATVLAGISVLSVILVMLIFLMRRSKGDSGEWVSEKVEPHIPPITSPTPEYEAESTAPTSSPETPTIILTPPDTAEATPYVNAESVPAYPLTQVNSDPYTEAANTGATEQIYSEPEIMSAIAIAAAEQAKATGVMVAAEGTVQGESGWYYDSSGELTNWRVETNGAWTRIQ